VSSGTLNLAQPTNQLTVTGLECVLIDRPVTEIAIFTTSLICCSVWWEVSGSELVIRTCGGAWFVDAEHAITNVSTPAHRLLHCRRGVMVVLDSCGVTQPDTTDHSWPVVSQSY